MVSRKLVETIQHVLTEKVTKGRIIEPSDPDHPKHAEWKAAQPKKERKPVVRKAKPIDTADHKLYKALEDHLGGSFEHYESEPKHGHDEHGHATMLARVTHSYTAADLGMKRDEMEDTSETHKVKIVKHPQHGYTVLPAGRGMNESIAESNYSDYGTPEYNDRLAAAIGMIKKSAESAAKHQDHMAKMRINPKTGESFDPEYAKKFHEKRAAQVAAITDTDAKKADATATTNVVTGSASRSSM